MCIVGVSLLMVWVIDVTAHHRCSECHCILCAVDVIVYFGCCCQRCNRHMRIIVDVILYCVFSLLLIMRVVTNDIVVGEVIEKDDGDGDDRFCEKFPESVDVFLTCEA